MFYKMGTYGEGLNNVPMLTQSTTPPCSGRSRLSLNRKRQQRSFICYNGNYEGDSSMFGEKGFDLEHLNLVDTESDNELQSASTTRSSSRIKQSCETNSLIWRLVQILILTFLKPELNEKISAHLDNFRQSCFYKWLTKWSTTFKILFTYIFYLTAILFKQLAALVHICWKQRVIFRNLVRRLLWRLTLAKCNDLSLFFLILLTIPILFLLSLIGFFISICGCLKDTLHHGRRILNKI